MTFSDATTFRLVSFYGNFCIGIFVVAVVVAAAAADFIVVAACTLRKSLGDVCVRH